MIMMKIVDDDFKEDGDGEEDDKCCAKFLIIGAPSSMNKNLHIDNSSSKWVETSLFVFFLAFVFVFAYWYFFWVS